MTTGAERKLGDRIARELYRDPDYIDDPILVDYVQGIWQPLLAAARARGDLSNELDERFAWQVLLGKDRSINAFALPGGWLGLHLGLVSVTVSRDELASVLAHELSHVTQRHISRLITAQSKQAPLLVAAMILGALAASKNPQAGQALMVGGQAAAAQLQLNFSRDMEREADRVGYGVLTQAGFEPQGFVSMFEKLQQASRLNDNGAFPYLRSHPMTSERVAEMQSRQQLAMRAAAPLRFDHLMAAGRARVLSNLNVDGLRGLVAEAENPSVAALPKFRQAGTLYAGAFAALRQRDFARAEALATRLATIVAQDPPGQRLTRLLRAEIALERGDAAGAITLLDAESRQRAEVLLLAQARMKTGRAAQAAQQLQTWVSTSPRDATAWQQLAAAYTAQGQPLRAIRAEAESQEAQLDHQGALDRFKAAQDVARRGGATQDHVEASIIDTRARQVESLLREQALER